MDSPRLMEQRLRRLEDLEAIRLLKYRYAQHANILGSPGDLKAFSELYADDALWDVGLGPFRGPKAIFEAMSGVTTQWLRAMHFMINPIITVEGDTATGLWSGLFPLVGPDNPRPLWHCLMYDESYVRTVQGWKFQSVRTIPVFEPPEFQKIYEAFLSKNATSPSAAAL